MSTETAKTMTTYEAANGEFVAGEFSFVTGLEWFEDDSEQTSLIRKTWRLVEQVEGTYWPSGADSLCGACDGDGMEDGCGVCHGTGDNATPREGFIVDVEDTP